MKHLPSLQQTFPHLLNRNAIMGIVEKKPRKSPATLAEEEAEVKLQSSQFVTVKVYFTIRPYLPPCHCSVISLPLKSRSSELLDVAWEQFSHYREKMGPLLGSLPSEEKEDYMLCFLQRGQPVTQGEFERILTALPTAGQEVMAPTAEQLGTPPPAFALTPAPQHHSLASSVEAQPLQLDALVGDGAAPPPFLSAAYDNKSPNTLGGMDVGRTVRSRSNSAVSSATVVTQESLGDEEDDIDPDDVDAEHQTAVESVLSEIREQKQWATAAAAMIPGYELMSAVEYCQPTAIVSRIAASRLAAQQLSSSTQHFDLHPNDAASSKAEAVKKVAASAELHDDGMVSFHLMLRPEVVQRERVVLEEEKTRFAVLQVFDRSWSTLTRFEAYCVEQTRSYQVRRMEEKRQIRDFEERELALRDKILHNEDHTWHEALGKFRRRYSELEVGMIAQYRQMRDIRKRHLEAMKQHGLAATEEE